MMTSFKNDLPELADVIATFVDSELTWSNHVEGGREPLVLEVSAVIRSAVAARFGDCKKKKESKSNFYYYYYNQVAFFFMIGDGGDDDDDGIYYQMMIIISWRFFFLGKGEASWLLR